MDTTGEDSGGGANDAFVVPDCPVPVADDAFDIEKTLLTQHEVESVEPKIDFEKPSSSPVVSVEVKAETATTTSRGSIENNVQPNNLKKKKLLRIEKRLKKLSAKGMTDVDMITKKSPKNTEKTLEQLLNEIPVDSKHKLKVHFVAFSYL